MKIESFEKGCEICGYDPTQRPVVSHLPEKHQQAIVSAYELFVISEASWKGEGKEIDWSDPNQEKWAPDFYLRKDKSNPTGFRFDDTFCVGTRTRATGGSRLCYPSDEDAEYHGQQHLEKYRNVQVIKK